jgi:hypothetical protein
MSGEKLIMTQDLLIPKIGQACMFFQLVKLKPGSGRMGKLFMSLSKRVRRVLSIKL